MSRVGYIFGLQRSLDRRSLVEMRCVAGRHGGGDEGVVETKEHEPSTPALQRSSPKRTACPRAGVLFATRSDRSWPITCLATRLATASAWSEPSLSQLPDRRPALTGSRVDDREATPSGALDEGRAGPRLAANPGEGTTPRPFISSSAASQLPKGPACGTKRFVRAEGERRRGNDLVDIVRRGTGRGGSFGVVESAVTNGDMPVIDRCVGASNAA